MHRWTTPLSAGCRRRQIEIAGHPVWALRMSYGGELGWELHMPREAMPAVYDALWAAGQAHGIADYGSFAMNVMRMEKGFKGAGELTNEVTLPEADVMRFVKPTRTNSGPGGKTLNAKPLPWVCAYLEIEPDGDMGRPWRRGGAAGWRGGRLDRVGRLWSHGRQGPGLRLHQAARRRTRNRLEVFMNETWRPARVLGEAAYDPAGLLPRTDAPACEAAQ
jgi:dimethylglycine dehydrogenase